MRKVGRRQAAWSRTALTLAALLNGSGCLRFAYHELDREHSSTQDAGMDAGAGQGSTDASTQPDAQLTAAAGGATGGSAARSGAGGAAGALAGSAANGGAGGQRAYAGDAAVDSPTDGGVSSDGGPSDAAMPAAGGGGTGGSGTGGSGGSGGALPFAQCTQGTGVVFCDGFEEAMPWTPYLWSYAKVTDNSTEETSTTIAYDRTSLHMSTVQNLRTTAARIAFSRLADLKSGHLWMRYYYYLPSTVTINKYFSAGVMSELSNPYQGFSLLIYPDTVQLESALIPTNVITTFTFPRDRWVCVEHHVFIDASVGFFEIYVDGGIQLKSAQTNSIPATGWTSAEVGIHYVGEGQGPVDVYVDNVVVSTARYGCD